MKFADIKQFPQIHYRTDIPIGHLEEYIFRMMNEHNLQINPDFQREHVWTRKQKINYVEYFLKNPSSGKEIYLNHPNWMNSFKGDFVLVDGKQRLNALIEFLNNKIPVFGFKKDQYEDKVPFLTISINIATLKTRKEVLQWYLDFNTGGTVHTLEEIQKVKKLIKKEE